MRLFMIIFYIFIAIIGVTFAALNASSVQINLYITTLKLPISVVMAIMLGMGMLIGCFLFICRYWRLKAEHRKIKNQLRLTEKEIKNLRAIPLQDQH